MSFVVSASLVECDESYTCKVWCGLPFNTDIANIPAPEVL